MFGIGDLEQLHNVCWRGTKAAVCTELKGKYAGEARRNLCAQS